VEEKELLKEHPAMFRNNPLMFILAFVLIFFYGMGLLILLSWWLQSLNTTLILTNKRTILRKGILSKYTNEVLHSNVRNVQVGQNVFQRIFGVGKIGISSAGQSGVEIEVSGIRNPQKVSKLIDEHRQL
jgi:uncharacterized membrane protein YdbT with pleckstrin-like domain